jgi:hypothetical protein
MDNNTKDVLVLAITTFSTIAIAWIKIRGSSTARSAPPPPPPAQPGEQG